jgi:siderophore synthetase component
VVELAQTLWSDAGQLARGRPAEELLDLDPLLLEGEMRGHPWIVANKGRIGFGTSDLARFAPEAQRPLAVRWLAAAPGRADARTTSSLTHAEVVAAQVGPEHWAELRAGAAAAGLDPDAATYLPVHPWQWDHRIRALHAGDLAHRRLVDLGEGPARYLPQQSIRTLADVDHPDRRYLKLSLSILNTSVYRGLPRARALAAPALTEWFTGLCGADPFLAEAGLVLLGEVASASVAHPALESVAGVPYQHTEMLGAIWRDSVEPQLAPGERAVTLAALLHRDPAGTPFVEPLIRRSGLTAEDWVARLHAVTLPPLVHVLYRFGATFSPHAQNCLLVLRDDVPVRLVVKDFVDDCMISGEDLPELRALPPAVRTALEGGIDSLILVQWIQGGLLVCVHRYLSEILDEHLGLPEARFWALAEATLRRYQERFADELGARFALFDLEAPAFVKLCLNRVRMLERGYADDAERPVASAVGFVENPLAGEDVA